MNSQNKFCKVHGCRYSWSHTTLGHECGTCHKFGHGQYECENTLKISNLNNIKDILPLNLQCSIKGCRFKEYHIKEIHKSSFSCDKKKIQYIIECPICRTINHINENQPKLYGVSDICCVCTEKNVELFFSNCGHACICLDCADNLNKNIKDYQKEITKEHQIDNNIKLFILKKFEGKNEKIFHTIKLDMGCSIWIRRKNQKSPLEGFFMHSDDWGQYGCNKRKLLLEDFLEGYSELA